MRLLRSEFLSVEILHSRIFMFSVFRHLYFVPSIHIDPYPIFLLLYPRTKGQKESFSYRCTGFMLKIHFSLLHFSPMDITLN